MVSNEWQSPRQRTVQATDREKRNLAIIEYP